MKRGALGKKVTLYKHPKFGGHIPLYLDTSTGRFSAEVVGNILSAGTLDELRSLLKTKLENSCELTWIPVIEITFYGRRWSDDRNTNGAIKAGVDVTCERSRIAKQLDGSWIECPWSDQHDDVIEEKDFLSKSREFGASFDWVGQRKVLHDVKLPFTVEGDHNESPTYYVGYTDELWAMLVQFTKRIDKFQETIIALLGSPASRNSLAEKMQKLLPGGKK